MEEKSIKEVEARIVEEFSLFDEWLDKYEYIIELGKSIPKMDQSGKVPENLISGCQSSVWLDCREEDGRLRFTADSDAVITKGIITLLIRVYDGRTPQEILDSDFSFIEKIGLKENLSPTRANGLVSMIKKLKTYALAFQAKEKNNG